MKKLVIVLALLLLVIPISLTKEVEILDVRDGQTEEGVDVGANYYAVLNDQIVASVKDGDVSYYHKDRLGSNVVGEGRSKTLPFGQETLDPGHAFTFTGKEEDSSGLYYFGARYYDSDLGRFVSTDPVVDNVNPFVYVRNNPLYFVDPSGGDETASTIFHAVIYKRGKGNLYYSNGEYEGVGTGEIFLGHVRGGNPDRKGTYGETKPGTFRVGEVYTAYTTTRWLKTLIPQGAEFSVDYETQRVMFDIEPQGPEMILERDIGRTTSGHKEFIHRASEIRELFSGVSIRDLYEHGLTFEQAEYLGLGEIVRTTAASPELRFILNEETYSRNYFGVLSVRLGGSGQLIHPGEVYNTGGSHGCVRLGECALDSMQQMLKPGDIINIETHYKEEYPGEWEKPTG